VTTITAAGASWRQRSHRCWADRYSGGEWGVTHNTTTQRHQAPERQRHVDDAHNHFTTRGDTIGGGETEGAEAHWCCERQRIRSSRNVRGTLTRRQNKNTSSCCASKFAVALGVLSSTIFNFQIGIEKDCAVSILLPPQPSANHSWAWRGKPAAGTVIRRVLDLPEFVHCSTSLEDVFPVVR